MVAGSEIVHLAAAPPTALDEEVVKKVAPVIGKSPYETRLRLTGRIPKIIANYSSMQAAQSAAESLRQMGLFVFVASDSELRKPPQLFRACSLKLEQQAITFCDRAGQPKRMEGGELFLIVSIRNQKHRETEVTTTKRKLNVPVALLTGLPVTKKVQEKSRSVTYYIESFLRLYCKTLAEPVVQINQDNFDYSFLGTEMAKSGAANYLAAIRKIREAFPQAIFDDGLTEPLGANMPATMTQDAVEANCKLIFWYHQAVNKPTTALQIRSA
jgi:hypothetical protein